MSLINKMLQELDKRHASQGAAAQPGSQKLASSLRPIAGGRVGSDLFWWIMAVVMLILIVWLAWVMWQVTPRPIATDLAYQHRQRMMAVKSAGSADTSSVPAATPAETAQSQEPAVSSAESPRVAAVTELKPPATTAKPDTMASGSSIDVLKLATSISTPIPERRASRGGASQPKADVTPPPKPDSAALSNVGKAPDPDRRPDAKPPSSAQERGKAESARVQSAPAADNLHAQPAEDAKLAVVAPQASSNAEPVRIDRRVTNSPFERAEVEYRRAVGLINQGRVAEGTDGLRSAISIEPGHEIARQTLVSLLMEQRRFDDAYPIIQKGLELNPSGSALASLLARILVERKDLPGALAILRKHSPGATGNADYHAFTAAVLQRLGRHAEAADEYQIALKLAPQSAAWWIGLGISQENVERRKEALVSFKRAQSIGGLSPDLVSFVEQRLRQLQ